MIKRLIGLLTLVVTGCTFMPTQKDAPSVFDLGAPKTYKEPSKRFPGSLLIYDVEAPQWLDSAGIVYRLNYIDASRQQLYATARWAASPPVLVSRKLRGTLAAASTGGVVSVADNARAHYALRVEIEEFSQLFDSATASRAVVMARASLIDISSRRLHAQNTFLVEQAAPSADAKGGVTALALAADELVEKIATWTVATLSAVRN